jgi:hypothetical protein
MTNASDDTPRPGEMTDGQLDRLLKAASTNLLDHITATADPNRALTAIMGRADQQAPAETPVSTMIRFRDAAHDIASALGVAPTSADDIERTHVLVRALGSALVPDRASDPVRALERTHDLSRTRSLVSDLAAEVARARDLGGARDLDLDRDLAAARDRDRDRDRDLAAALDLDRFDLDRAPDLDFGKTYARVGALARARARAREIARDRALAPDRALARAVNIIGILDLYLGLGLGRGRDPNFDADNDSYLSLAVLGLSRGVAGDIDRYLALGRDVASDIDRASEIALASALDHARATAQDLDSHELDASGEDLSGIEIRHLDAVDGITWTRETTWPPAIAGHVEENSYEIQPGVYQVHLGDTRDRHMLLTLA